MAGLHVTLFRPCIGMEILFLNGKNVPMAAKYKLKARCLRMSGIHVEPIKRTRPKYDPQI